MDHTNHQMVDVEEENKTIGHNRMMALYKYTHEMFDEPINRMHFETETRCLMARLLKGER